MGLQLDPEIDDRTARGSVTIGPYLQVDGIAWPNAATLLTLADVLIGRLASYHTAPRISVTADLGVRLFDPPVGERLQMRARMRKVGQTMSVGDADLFSESGQLVGTCLGTFLASPRPADQAFLGLTGEMGVSAPTARNLAALRTDLENATESLQGGVVALLGETAIYSAVATDGGATHVVETFEAHYLAAGRIGPFRATAEVLRRNADRAYCRVEVGDLGRDRLCAIIETTTRTFGT
jgi:acyl-coenzyme A thioesterase PaaI-like protein